VCLFFGLNVLLVKSIKMEIFVFIFLLYYGVQLLFLIFELLVDSIIVMLKRHMSRKNKLIIRHWEWLRAMGYEESALIILKKMDV